jgi:hypothetical protein
LRSNGSGSRLGSSSSSSRLGSLFLLGSFFLLGGFSSRLFLGFFLLGSRSRSYIMYIYVNVLLQKRP